MGDLVGFLRAQGGGRLNGVNWALFLAGDIADSFFHEVVVDGIDLRLVVDASPGSEMQRSFIREMESTVDDYLAQKGLDYTQKTGDNWHRGRRSFDPDDHEYERYMDHFGRHNDIRFVIDPDPAKYQRKIDIVINAIGSRGIEEQEKWEWASRKGSLLSWQIPVFLPSIYNRIPLNVLYFILCPSTLLRTSSELCCTPNCLGKP